MKRRNEYDLNKFSWLDDTVENTMKVSIKSTLIEGSSIFKASALENVSRMEFGSVSRKSYANNYADRNIVIKYDRNRKSHDVQKE